MHFLIHRYFQAELAAPQSKMADSDLRNKLHARIAELEGEELRRVAALVLPKSTPAVAATPGDAIARDWPHSPLHRLGDHGAFIVTAATLYKKPIFRGAAQLDLLHDNLLTFARKHQWHLEAWAVFPNHYHFVGQTAEGASKLNVFLSQLHSQMATEINRLHKTPARKVWHNFWETKLTYERSYLARLAYVHQNAVRHGLVREANQYRWCSAGWFERSATAAQVKTIYNFKIDRVKVLDAFEVAGPDCE